MYDLERLRDDINLKLILPQILSPDEISYAGSTMYCKCVSGLHDETKVEHNAVYEKTCHCYSCGENHDAFTYIKKYYENQGSPLSFSEICEKIGDAMGGADFYVTDKKIKKKNLPLSQEELQIIGISSTSGRNTPSLALLYEKSPEKVKNILLQKAHEKMLKYRALGERVEEERLRQTYIELYQKCREIYENLGGSEKSMVALFRI